MAEGLLTPALLSSGLGLTSGFIGGLLAETSRRRSTAILRTLDKLQTLSDDAYEAISRAGAKSSDPPALHALNRLQRRIGIDLHKQLGTRTNYGQVKGALVVLGKIIGQIEDVAGAEPTQGEVDALEAKLSDGISALDAAARACAREYPMWRIFGRA